MAGTHKDLGLCQVRSETENPCPRPAVVEIWGLPFCEVCAREQEAYFAIGELTRIQTLATDETRGHPSPSGTALIQALGRVQRDMTRRMSGTHRRSLDAKRRRPDQGDLSATTEAENP